MPFASDKQRRFMYAAEGRGELKMRHHYKRKSKHKKASVDLGTTLGQLAAINRRGKL